MLYEEMSHLAYDQPKKRCEIFRPTPLHSMRYSSTSHSCIAFSTLLPRTHIS
jgi:hypothetical protein